MQSSSSHTKTMTAGVGKVDRVVSCAVKPFRVAAHRTSRRLARQSIHVFLSEMDMDADPVPFTAPVLNQFDIY